MRSSIRGGVRRGLRAGRAGGGGRGGPRAGGGGPGEEARHALLAVPPGPLPQGPRGDPEDPAEVRCPRAPLDILLDRAQPEPDVVPDHGWSPPGATDVLLPYAATCVATYNYRSARRDPGEETVPRQIPGHGNFDAESGQGPWPQRRGDQVLTVK